MKKRNMEIYRLRKEEGYTTAKLADMFKVTRSRISCICKQMEHKKKIYNNSYFLCELPLRMRIVLRKRFGDEIKATPEKVAILDPSEIVRALNIGKITLKQTKDILLKNNVQHLMHENWNRF